MRNLFTVIKRPIITEKGLDQKEDKGILCFEIDVNANKGDVKEAIEKLFKVKVASVKTLSFYGKERRRGRYSGYKRDWKKAYVKLKPGEKMIEYAENL
jgi:large subunit ribosomal protein L23